MFFDEGFTSFHLHGVERVDFGYFRDKVRAKFDGVIIGAMGRELVMDFLREDISKVFAPFQYNWFC